jgi:16S rRNA (cytosine1402-N4)-methyltransferase
MRCYSKLALIKGVSQVTAVDVHSLVGSVGTSLYASTTIKPCGFRQDATTRLPSTRVHHLMFATHANLFNDPQDDESVDSRGETDSLVSSKGRQRRVRYRGNYPRNFADKYKELSGDEETIQKVLRKGMTPAGRHVPILVKECMTHLGLCDQSLIEEHSASKEAVFFVDCTLGYGGHSTAVLRWLLENQITMTDHSHRMVCFDRDPIEISKATERLVRVYDEYLDVVGDEMDVNNRNGLITTINRNFCDLRYYLETHDASNNQIGKVTALLADLGFSSMQIDDASRGFTYKREGPLDMRMNASEGDATMNSENAYDLLSRITVNELTKMLQENSDEEHSSTIAQAIVGSKHIPLTTTELANVVRDAVRPHISPKQKKPQQSSENSRRDSPIVRQQLDATVARVMQAIRIEVNNEFESLQQLLDDLPLILAPGGRAVFLTFHSGEDRRVKKAFKSGYKDGIYSSWSRDVIKPTPEERRDNPRSSCCKLRWVVRSNKIAT